MRDCTGWRTFKKLVLGGYWTPSGKTQSKKTRTKNTIKTLKTRTMKKTLNTSEAIDCLLRDCYARWTRDGARAMIEHLEQLEEETGEEIEMDPCAIRCDYSEHPTAWEACDDLDLEVTGETEDPEGEAIARLEKAGVLVAHLENGGVIVSNY